jgi:hypothetical protein
MTDKTARKGLRVFMSYSHRDDRIASELAKHLSALRRSAKISTWYDVEIPSLAEFEAEITMDLEESQIIVLLVSADFLMLDYCYSREMRHALETHDRAEAVVVPIIIRPCDWTAAPFGKLLVLPRDARPITAWSQRDAA